MISKIKKYFWKKWSISLIRMIIIFVSLLPALSLASACQGRIFNPLTDICWDCFFPLTIGNFKVIDGKNPDTDNPVNPICHCGGSPFSGWGITIGFWEPVLLIDVTRHPYCMVNLGGVSLEGLRKVGEGDIETSSDNNQSFYYFHAIDFPIMNILFPFFKGKCHSTSSIGLNYFSELDPAWNNESLNTILYPELTYVVNNITFSQILAANDCINANTHLPNDKIFWVAGCQGSLYPLEGEIQEHVNSVQAATLIAERGILLLHHLGLMRDSSPKHLCGETVQYHLPKSRYRYQMIYPKNKECYSFGHSSATWESNVITPTSSEDYGFIIWKKKNCCSN